MMNRNRQAVFLVILAVAAAGCSTTVSPNGYRRDFLTFGGERYQKYQDPRLEANSGVVAYSGINGPSGPYAAALAVGSISDPAARRDAAETIKSVAENEGAYGGGRAAGGYRGYHGGFRQLGYLLNNSNETRFVSVDGSRPIEVLPWRKLFLELLPGDHQLVVTSRSGAFIKERSFVVNEERRDAPDHLHDWMQNI
ncbi:MAG: hypothetical protein WC518_03775 [Patescibacteria group bacterium]